jgi:hypothetical protein
MNTLRSELGLIKNRFPEHQAVIEDLYKTDPDFKSLCSDLFLCSKMIQDFETDMREKQRALNEYREIEKELEKELAVIVQAVEQIK